MANELPEDLVTQILLWLPVVSLLRFKSVCKSWYALITHQNFVREHILHKNNTSIILLLGDKTTKDYVVSMLSYETLQVSLTQPLPPPYFGIDKRVEICIVGSCNGLVCLHDYYELYVVLWNPATKETKVVPKSNVPRFPPDYCPRLVGRFGFDYFQWKLSTKEETNVFPKSNLTHFPPDYRSKLVNGLEFGFDAKTNDYKIVRVLIIYDPDPGYDESNPVEKDFIHQSEVYSLSTNSWRKVDSPPCFLRNGTRRVMMTCNNGMASWMAYGDNWNGVLSFDMSDEVFLKTPLPDDVEADDLNCLKVFLVLNESIAIAVNVCQLDVEPLEEYFDIWLLLEVGVKDSWSKVFTIGPFTDIDRPFGSWKNDTLLLEICEDGMFWEKPEGLVLYDPSTEEMTNLQIGHGVTLESLMTTYMETLVSVNGGNEFEEQAVVDNA